MTLARRLVWYHRLGMPLYHVAAIATVALVRPSRVAIVVFLVSYAARALGVAAGFHRLFTHRAWRTTRPIAFVLALFGGLAGQGTISRWVLHHTKHHRFVDRDGDLHSPGVGGLWHAHVGWLWRVSTFEDEHEARALRRKWPVEIAWLDRAIPVLLLLNGVVLYLVGGFELLGWGYFVPIVLYWHATFLVNSACHSWGSRIFETSDQSRNNTLVNLLVLGEGLHNNHHAWPSNARFGLRPGQLDPTFWLIQMLAWIGLARIVTDKSESDIREALARRERGRDAASSRAEPGPESATFVEP